MTDQVKPKYTGSALPGNAETVEIFSTVSARFPKNGLSQMGLARFELFVNNDQAGTLVEQKSMDRGVTWKTISSTAVSAASANSQNFNDYLVEPYADWRLRWTNGATPQTTFDVDAALSSQRTVAT